MDYFVSHFGILIGASLFVAFCAFLWWFLMDTNARLKRERAQARMEEAKKRKEAEMNQKVDNPTE
ncbi:MAG: hypothetical protein Q4C18_00225 [Eubacteriales bacterium]|nr:hypothetical protein [Eubacteriales bacterium]